jgi:RNA polymerase sigma-70 factor (ECF subfamily)
MPRPSRARFLRELEAHVDAGYNFARWLTGGSDEAEDLVHDALARALAHWNQYTPGTQMKSWLFTIVRRTFLNRLRRGKYEVNSSEYPENEELLSAESQGVDLARLPTGLLRRDLDAALATLPEAQRSLVLLADLEELSLEEIAAIMEIPVGTVKSRLWRARHSLRKKLAGYEGA